MSVAATYRKGFHEAIRVTGKSSRRASLDAGFNENQLNRFLSGDTDMKLGTLVDLCEKGFDLPMETIFRMGK